MSYPRTYTAGEVGELTLAAAEAAVAPFRVKLEASEQRDYSLQRSLAKTVSAFQVRQAQEELKSTQGTAYGAGVDALADRLLEKMEKAS